MYKFTEEQEKEIIDYYLVPNTVSTVVNTLGISRKAVERILKKHNISHHQKELNSLLTSKVRLKNKILVEDEQKIIDFYLVPNSVNATAKAFNISTTAVDYILKRHNILKHKEKIHQPHKKLGIASEQDIINYYIEQKSISKVMLKFNITRKTINKIILKNNIKLPVKVTTKQTKRKHKLNIIIDKKLEDEVIKFYLAPNTLSKTIETFKLTKYIVKKILKNNNISLHNKTTITALQKKTCLEKYGAESPMHVEKFKEKLKQNNLEKYGVEYAFQAKEVKEKIKNSNIKHFGGPNPSCSRAVREKASSTMLSRYGTLHVFSQKYAVEEQYFDSFPEVCFYLYYVNNNINIKREPVIFVYSFNGIDHKYLPDFKVNEQLYELKGNQFLAKDGK